MPSAKWITKYLLVVCNHMYAKQPTENSVKPVASEVDSYVNGKKCTYIKKKVMAN